MVASLIIFWQKLCSAQKKPAVLCPCVDLRRTLSWSSAAHAVSSFNVLHIPPPAPSLQLLKIKREEMGKKKGPKQSTSFPLQPPTYRIYLPHWPASLHVSLQDSATLQFCANKLDKKDFFGKSDPFMVFYRSNEDGTWVSSVAQFVSSSCSSFELKISSISPNDARGSSLRYWGADPKVQPKLRYQREVGIIRCFSLTRAN